jgi:hypothetical protein
MLGKGYCGKGQLSWWMVDEGGLGSFGLGNAFQANKAAGT